MQPDKKLPSLDDLEDEAVPNGPALLPETNGHSAALPTAPTVRFKDADLRKVLSVIPHWVKKEITTSEISEDLRLEQERKAADVLKKVGLVIDGDPQMMLMWNQVRLASRGDGQVLLRGPTGTGKELVFTAIHKLHAADEGAASYQLNGAGLSPGVIESELFGHAKGSFTGAHIEREGAFEIVAKGGTLLLDEIGDMPIDQQAKLLRVLQTREFSRVGSNKIIKLEGTKIVAATNRPLEKLVVQKLFRQDLLYRLTEHEVSIPSLAERTLDHRVALIDHFIQEMKNGHDIYMTPDALQLFLDLPYNGNVRDLRHHVRRASICAMNNMEGNIHIEARHVEESRQQDPNIAYDGQVRLEDFCDGALKLASEKGVIHAQIVVKKMRQNFKEVMECIDQQTILAALDACDGVQTQAALLTGITRGTIRDRKNHNEPDNGQND